MKSKNALYYVVIFSLFYCYISVLLCFLLLYIDCFSCCKGTKSSRVGKKIFGSCNYCLGRISNLLVVQGEMAGCEAVVVAEAVGLTFEGFDPAACPISFADLAPAEQGRMRSRWRETIPETGQDAVAIRLHGIRHAFPLFDMLYYGLGHVFLTAAYLLPDSELTTQIAKVHRLSVLFVHYQNIDGCILLIFPMQFCEEPAVSTPFHSLMTNLSKTTHRLPL